MSQQVADNFEPVETPPFEQRFRYTSGVKVECVMCGQTGYHPTVPRKRHWSTAHEHHVRCTCGQIVSRKGIGAHRGAKRRHGDPCPPYPGEIVELLFEPELTTQDLVLWWRKHLVLR